VRDRAVVERQAFQRGRRDLVERHERFDRQTAPVRLDHAQDEQPAVLGRERRFRNVLTGQLRILGQNPLTDTDFLDWTRDEFTDLLLFTSGSDSVNCLR